MMKLDNSYAEELKKKESLLESQKEELESERANAQNYKKKYKKVKKELEIR